MHCVKQFQGEQTDFCVIGYFQKCQVIVSIRRSYQLDEVSTVDLFSLQLHTLEHIGSGVGRVLVYKEEDEPNSTECRTLAEWTNEACTVCVCVYV